MIWYLLTTLALSLCLVVAVAKRPKTPKKPGPYDEFDHPPEVLAELYTADQLLKMVNRFAMAVNVEGADKKGTWKLQAGQVDEIDLVRRLRAARGLRCLQDEAKPPQDDPTDG